MKLLSVLDETFQKIIKEVRKPKSHTFAEKFEDYIRLSIFTDECYHLVERMHNYSHNSKNFVESSLKPDFKFRDRITKREFYVEAKFRSVSFNKITWCTDKQLKRYTIYNNDAPVFLFLGLGGAPDEPEQVALIPLSAAKYTSLYPSYVAKFEIHAHMPVQSHVLWER